MVSIEPTSFLDVLKYSGRLSLALWQVYQETADKLVDYVVGDSFWVRVYWSKLSSIWLTLATVMFVIKAIFSRVG